MSAVSSDLSALTLANDATVVSQYTPNEYEMTSYYNGITGDTDHAELFTPIGRHAHIPVKSLRGVFDTPLNGVWDTVGPEIRDLIKARKINWSSVDPARFFTHGPLGEEEKGSLGPIVIWVGVIPGSTSSDTAHEVSQEILALLLKNGVQDAVVEWHEAVPQRLAGPPLMRHVSSNNATHYVRPFLTALLGIPLATEGMEEEDAQGTLTLWFHENKDKDGNPSDKVYGVSNCHVLRKDTTVEYEHSGGAPKDHVRVCGMRRFQRGLDEIRKVIGDHGILADLWAREIVKLEVKERKDAENARLKRRNLEDENEAIADLGPCTMKSRNTAITVDVEGGTLYTSDWAAFLAAEAKVKDEFEGSVVDLGSKYSPPELTAMFYPLGGGATTFKFPEERKLRIEGCATKEDLANPADAALSSVKDGNTTDLTVGRYAGLVSFTLNEVGIESVELGRLGSLVWHTTNGEAHIVGQLHSASNKGGSTSNHVTYCTPGWYFLDQIRKKFKHADFYRTTWSA
ncbi:hypothetical protein B0H10DRAFT_2167577 [Mycena sp. CBHHK59/15]|nr:hypothetical protein B0H10DRAFT_2167577 [Mycena sp. CBHHK59/15]